MTAPSAKYGFTGDELRRRLQAYDRTPFLDLLGVFLECAPTELDIKAMAKKNPDKWMNAMSQLARTAGFTDKTETTHNVNLNIGQMSDSQLEDRVRHLQQQLALPAPDEGSAAIDAVFEELPERDA